MAEGSTYQKEPTIIKKTFLFSQKTNKRFRLNGIKESSQLPEKASLRKDFSNHIIYQPSQLPPKVDLRPWMTKVEDQSDANSCTANALAGIYEYLNNRDTGSQIDVSRLFIYYNSRVKGLDADETISDDGAALCDAIESMEELGVCPESQWPYDLKNVNAKPSQQCYIVAANYTISQALKLNIDINEIKICIAQGFPVIISLNLYTSFDKASDSGIVPMPKTNETSRSGHGRHALLIAGYSDASEAFIVRNSWGEDWGDKGYCYIPYDYIGSDKLCNSAWTVKRLGVDYMGKEAWHVTDNINYRQGAYYIDEYEDGDDDIRIEEIEEEEEYYYQNPVTNDSGDDDGDGENLKSTHADDDDGDDKVEDGEGDDDDDKGEDGDGGEGDGADDDGDNENGDDGDDNDDGDDAAGDDGDGDGDDADDDGDGENEGGDDGEGGDDDADGDDGDEGGDADDDDAEGGGDDTDGDDGDEGGDADDDDADGADADEGGDDGEGDGDDEDEGADDGDEDGDDGNE
ncbi:unnamed protein product [Adineta steineri]|uniref:Peptidase C1A papain C-terminal domain-containing protein n=1 Tax=Adineta steineri TaxID=433720 RepID=A0A815SIL5_9BILA|nr:unnamed protein product [Adineta steineri]CAF4073722.1 unnamed protein product [Adineta steineri]